MNDPLMTVDELAEYLRTSRSWVYEWLHAIPSFKIGKKRLFRTSEVNAWLEAYRKGIPPALL